MEQRILCEILGCQYNKDEWCGKEEKKADGSVPAYCPLKLMDEWIEECKEE